MHQQDYARARSLHDENGEILAFAIIFLLDFKHIMLQINQNGFVESGCVIIRKYNGPLFEATSARSTINKL